MSRMRSTPSSLGFRSPTSSRDERCNLFETTSDDDFWEPTLEEYDQVFPKQDSFANPPFLESTPSIPSSSTTAPLEEATTAMQGEYTMTTAPKAIMTPTAETLTPVASISSLVLAAPAPSTIETRQPPPRWSEDERQDRDEALLPSTVPTCTMMCTSFSCAVCHASTMAGAPPRFLPTAVTPNISRPLPRCKRRWWKCDDDDDDDDDDNNNNLPDTTYGAAVMAPSSSSSYSSSTSSSFGSNKRRRSTQPTTTTSTTITNPFRWALELQVWIDSKFNMLDDLAMEEDEAEEERDAENEGRLF